MSEQQTSAPQGIRRSRPAVAEDMALAMRLAEIARTLWSSRSEVATLQKVVDTAVDFVSPSAAASVSMSHGAQVGTPAWSHPSAVDVDTLQYATGEGPCLDAVRQGGVVYAEDLRTDERWPLFGPRAAACGMRSLLSVRLGVEDAFGSLNLYARAPSAYPAEERTKATVFAAHAGVAVAAARELERLGLEVATERKRFHRLERAIPSHGAVGLAEGILMEQGGMTREQAFTALRRASLQVGTNVADIARYVIRARKLPTPARGRPVA